MKCKKCGNELEKNSNVCKNCGTKTLKKLSKKQIVLIVIVGLIFTFSGTIFDLIISNFVVFDSDYEFLELDLNRVAYSYENTEKIKAEEKGKYEVSLDYTKNNVIMVSDLKKFLKKEGYKKYYIDNKDKRLLKKCDGYVTISEDKEWKDQSKQKTYLKCGKEYATKGYDNNINKTVLNINKKEIEKEIEISETGEYYITKKENKLQLKTKYNVSTYVIGDMIEDEEVIGIYKCESKICEMANNEDDKNDTVLINDNKKVVLYNYKTNEKIKTSVKVKGSYNEFEKAVYNNEIVGIINNKFIDGDVIYYSLKDKKITVNLGESEIGNRNKLFFYPSYYKKGYIVRYNIITNATNIPNSKYVRMLENTYYSIIDINTNKELKNTVIDDGKYVESNGIPVLSKKDGNHLLDDNFNVVLKNTYSNYYEVENKVYAYSYNRYATYDRNSKESKEYEKQIVSEQGKYFITYNNNSVQVYNADTNSVIKSISFNAPKDLQLQTEYLTNKNNIDIDGMNFNGTYLFLMKEYMKCDAYKINESNNSVDLVYSNISYCGY